MKNYEIILSSETMDDYTTYDLIESPSIESLKTLENHDIIEVSKWIHYRTEDGQEILAVQDDMTGMCYSGQSKSFREGFNNILDRVSLMDTKPSSIYIEVIKRRSKSGRDYLLCALVSPDKVAKRFGNPFTEMPTPEK